MEEDSRPQLDLGEPVGRLGRMARPPGSRLLAAILVLQIAAAALLVAVLAGGGGAGIAGASHDVASEIRAAAMDLEDRGLALEAARQWERYADAAPAAPDRAQVLYRAGNAWFDAREYEKAAAAFLRAERAPGCDAALREKMGPRMVDCLRNAGLHGEVGRELARRTSANEEGGAPARVLAAFGGEPFTETDLDRLIRFRVERLLALQGMAGDGRAREALLAQMGDPGVRREIFMEILRTELLSRRARELELDASEEFQSALALAEQELLAAMLLERETGNAAPAAVDLEAFFHAHRDDYAGEDGVVPELDDVRDKVAADYTARKRAELGERLMTDLMSRYDVRIDQAALRPAGGPGDAAGESSEEGAKK